MLEDLTVVWRRRADWDFVSALPHLTRLETNQLEPGSAVEGLTGLRELKLTKKCSAAVIDRLKRPDLRIIGPLALVHSSDDSSSSESESSSSSTESSSSNTSSSSE
eukprot:TRINITY_DN8230_c0_g1_i1.p3 TRINITY_DN8230_c0_g1~~TRINITY_DN8230_c0_g1_i1.p3  ORF type:complete len:106 (-),score=26.97 TRINITY_DN8230_c0_g1_i1:371-688(-)